MRVSCFRPGGDTTLGGTIGSEHDYSLADIARQHGGARNESAIARTYRDRFVELFSSPEGMIAWQDQEADKM
jgi:hypothetical protein